MDFSPTNAPHSQWPSTSLRGTHQFYIYIYIYIYIHIALPHIKERVVVKLASLYGFGFLVWTLRSRRDIERNVLKAKHRKHTSSSQNSVRGADHKSPRMPLTTSRFILRLFFFFFFFFFLAAIFMLDHSLNSFVFFVFLSNFTFPSVSVLCQVGSRCHRNHQRLRPLSLSVFRSLSLSICPPSSLSSDVINIYFHATLRRRRREGGRNGEESLSGF